ncbi:MAG: pre-toxin TG domain-containing protein [Clostridium sp.]
MPNEEYVVNNEVEVSKEEVGELTKGLVGLDPEDCSFKEGDDTLVFARNGMPYLARVYKIKERDALGKEKLFAIPYELKAFYLDNANSEALSGPELLSVILDFAPIFGDFKEVYELCSGKDMITGEELNRIIMIAAVLAPSILGGPIKKLAKRGIKGGEALAKELKIISKAATNLAETVVKMKKAIKKSANDLNSLVRKIYERQAGVLDVEFAGYGRLQFNEADILVDADQICSDRYAKWIKDKLIESGTLISKDGKFIDNILEEDYEKYLKRKAKEGKLPRERLDWKEARDYWLNDSPMARGNAFNNKAVKEQWYKYNEVHLSNGKRVDSYDPIKGEIISRKATDLDAIQLNTYEKYLIELKNKYAPGTIIRTNKYDDIDGKQLLGKQILEIPISNRSFEQIQQYIDLAKSKYNIEIRFMEE